MSGDTGHLRSDHRRERKLRRAVRLGLSVTAGILLVGTLAMWIVTRSWFIVWRAQPELERRLGGAIEIGSAEYTGSGCFHVHDMKLRAPGIAGPAGEVLECGLVRVVVEPLKLFRGRIDLLGIELDDVRLRLSEDAHQAGRFSFMSLAPEWAPGDGRLPYVRINGARLEVGSHDENGEYVAVGERCVIGEMSPLPDQLGWMFFKLTETNEDDVEIEGGLTLDGQCNLAQSSFRVGVNGLTLDARSYSMCPKIIRLWGNKMDLEGRLSTVDVRWDPARGLSADFEMEDVGLTLPVEAGILWARYQDGQIETHSDRPRMHVSSGSMHLTSASLELRRLSGDIRGTNSQSDATPVPYTVSMLLNDLPPLDWADKEAWFDDVMSTTPFDVSVELDDFLYGPDEQGRSRPVDLPLLVARFLERFALEQWRLTTSVEISRAEPTVLPDGTRVAANIATSGRASIYDATGAFERFPYLLEDLRGELVFDERQITVHELTGRGSGDAILRVDGIIAPPGPEARVDLTLTAQQIQLDDRFRNALNEGQRSVLESLIHLPSSESLATAGLLLDAADVAAARTRLAVVGNLIGDARSGDPVVEDLEREARQLQRLIDMGPFEIGGTVNLDLRLQREQGVGTPTTAEGTIEIERAGLLFERFPYPMTITGGSVTWSPEGIGIDGEGLPLTTSGGGGGFVSGSIDLVEREGGMAMVPRITVDIEEDRVTRTMIAAVPPSAAELADLPPGTAWAGAVTSRGGRLLEDVNLEAALDYSGRIGLDDEDAMTFDLDVTVHSGTIDVAEQLLSRIGGSVEMAPGALAFRDVEGSARVTRDVLELRSLTGSHEICSVNATGRVGLGPGEQDTRLRLDVHDIAVDRRFFEMIGVDDTDGAFRELWDRYQPSGDVDARVEYTGDADGGKATLYLLPRSLFARIQDEPMHFRRTAGRLQVEGKTLRAEGLTFMIDRGLVSDGTISLDGSWALDGDRRLDVNAAWTDGEVASPLVLEAVLRTRALEEDLLAGFDPSGRFDGDMHFTHDAASGLGFDMLLRPRTLTFTREGVAITSTFAEGSAVRVTPEVIDVIGLDGTLLDASYHVDGRVGLRPHFTATLDLEYTGSLLDPQFRAILPPGTNGLLDTIDFKDGNHTRLTNCRADLELLPGETGGWSSVINADLIASDAAFDVGMKLSGIDGLFRLSTQREPGELTQFELGIEADTMVVYGQPIRDVVAHIGSTPSSDAVVIHSLRGDLHGGAVSFEGLAGINDRRDYHFAIRLAGVSLDPTLRAAATADEPIAEAAGDAGDGADRSGQIFAGIDLYGLRGDGTTRNGRGMIRILQGKVASVPAVLHAVQLTQLTMPMNNMIDYADIDFYLDGRTLEFENLLFESSIGEISQLQLIGDGGLDLDTMTLDVGFRVRGGLPLVRELVGGIGDQFYRVRVKGPLGDPEATIEAFPREDTLPAITMRTPPD
ncbi:MAG: hypothetical protein ACYTF9_05060 [Planctomycetota bacterium]